MRSSMANRASGPPPSLFCDPFPGVGKNYALVDTAVQALTAELGSRRHAAHALQTNQLMHHVPLQGSLASSQALKMASQRCAGTRCELVWRQ